MVADTPQKCTLYIWKLNAAHLLACPVNQGHAEQIELSCPHLGVDEVLHNQLFDVPRGASCWHLLSATELGHLSLILDTCLSELCVTSHRALPSSFDKELVAHRTSSEIKAERRLEPNSRGTADFLTAVRFNALCNRGLADKIWLSKPAQKKTSPFQLLWLRAPSW